MQKKVKDIYEPITWQCAFGHQFKSSVNAVLHGGHWCPECLRYEWHYDEIANNNPFYAQFWKATHGEGDDYKIPMKFSAFDIMKDLKNTLNMK